MASRTDFVQLWSAFGPEGQANAEHTSQPSRRAEVARLWEVLVTGSKLQSDADDFVSGKTVLADEEGPTKTMRGEGQVEGDVIMDDSVKKENGVLPPDSAAAAADSEGVDSADHALLSSDPPGSDEAMAEKAVVGAGETHSPVPAARPTAATGPTAAASTTSTPAPPRTSAPPPTRAAAAPTQAAAAPTQEAAAAPPAQAGAPPTQAAVAAPSTQAAAAAPPTQAAAAPTQAAIAPIQEAAPAAASTGAAAAPTRATLATPAVSPTAPVPPAQAAPTCASAESSLIPAESSPAPAATKPAASINTATATANNSSKSHQAPLSDRAATSSPRVETKAAVATGKRSLGAEVKRDDKVAGGDGGDVPTAGGVTAATTGDVKGNQDQGNDIGPGIFHRGSDSGGRGFTSSSPPPQDTPKGTRGKGEGVNSGVVDLLGRGVDTSYSNKPGAVGGKVGGDGQDDRGSMELDAKGRVPLDTVRRFVARTTGVSPSHQTNVWEIKTLFFGWVKSGT